MAGFTYPNESPEYRRARNELLQAETALRAQIEAVAQQRRSLPQGGRLYPEPVFQQADSHGQVHDVRFEQLFGEHRQLIVYSMMYGDEWDAPCPSCTSIVDGLETACLGVSRMASMAVVADASPIKLQQWAQQRGWKRLNLLSAHNTSYLLDYAAFSGAADGTVVSALNSFNKTEQGIFHHWGCELSGVPFGDNGPRHVDMIWPMWNLLDTVPGGRGPFGVPKQDFKHEYFSQHIYPEDS